jgi:hypothetical protein
LIGKKIIIEKLKKNKPFDMHRSRFFVYYVIVLPDKNGKVVKLFLSEVRRRVNRDRRASSFDEASAFAKAMADREVGSRRQMPEV